MTGILRCPLCHLELVLDARIAGCPTGHRFDRAREGYLHLLTPGRSRKRSPGDDADMIADRRHFLDHGHYRVLADGLRQLTAELAPSTLLDVGCGEGTFTAAMLDSLPSDDDPDTPFVALDISRPAVRLATRRCPTALCAIASVNDLPALDRSVELLSSVMSPTHEGEFDRVLADGGRIVLVTPGASHLEQLRALLYETFRPHDEQVPLLPDTDRWRLVEQHRFIDQVHLGTTDEILQVWGMTPYRWNAPVQGAIRVAQLPELDVTVHFVASVIERA